MSHIDISKLDKYFCVQIERLQAVEQKKDDSKLQYEISRTKAIVAISRRIILHSYYTRKYGKTFMF